MKNLLDAKTFACRVINNKISKPTNPSLFLFFLAHTEYCGLVIGKAHRATKEITKIYKHWNKLGKGKHFFSCVWLITTAVFLRFYA